VHLVPMGSEVWIVSGTDRIGVVPSEVAGDIWPCIAGGWAFAGRVEEVDARTALAPVRGHPTR
jgi:hypothetical protein